METIGWIASILLAICGFPELIRTLKDKKCYLGYGFLTCWYVGEIMAFIYIFPKLDLPLLFNYSINIVILSIMWYYKLKE
jgi:uncharacterized protein with PQ loop repeat